MIDSIKNLLAVSFISLIIGFSAGWYSEAKLIKANHLDSVIEAQRQTASEIQESLNTSLDAGKKITESNANIQTIRKNVAKHLSKDLQNEASISIGGCNNLYLDDFTVRMLNAARSGDIVGSAIRSDAEVETTSSVTVADLVDNDLQVVDLYIELSIRHDTLVDWVGEQVEKQAK